MAQINQPQRKEDPLDTVMKGLQIANGVLGIKESINKQSNEDVLSPLQLGTLQAQGATIVDANTPGALGVKHRDVEGNISPMWLSIPKTKVEGEKTQTYQDPVTGQSKIGRFVPGQGVVTSPNDLLAAEKDKNEMPKDVSGYQTKSRQPVYRNAQGFTDVAGNPVKQEDVIIARPSKDISIQERNTLQHQYDGDLEVKANKLVFDSYREASQILNGPQSPASDLSLVYAYSKANDPNSVVRPSEEEQARALGGLYNEAQAKLKAMAGNGLLSEEQRKNLFDQIANKATAKTQLQDSLEKQFADLANRRGVDLNDLRLTVKPKVVYFNELQDQLKKEQAAQALQELQRREKQRSSSLNKKTTFAAPNGPSQAPAGLSAPVSEQQAIMQSGGR